jgi:hypothetical protein
MFLKYKMSNYTKIQDIMFDKDINKSSIFSKIEYFQDNLPIDYWFEKYFTALFCMAVVYNKEPISSDKSSFDNSGNLSECQKGMKCFIESLCHVMPNKLYKNYLKKFLIMDKEVIQELINIDVLSRFFNVYKGFYNLLISRTSQVFNDCLQNSDAFFMYIYVMYIFLLNKKRVDGYTELPPFSKIREIYTNTLNAKNLWGNATWFLIHTTALYLPKNLSMGEFNQWRSMLDCLKNILPCQLCRNHLKENITYLNLENCGSNNIEAFKCTVNLHNIVNRSLGKVEIGIDKNNNIVLEDVAILYIPNSYIKNIIHY